MELFKREDYLKKIRGFYHDDGMIKVITGVRRYGKSCLMQTIAQELQDSGINPENLIYLDLYRYGYRKIRTADQLENLIAPALNLTGKKYLFIDEIQNVKNFEEVVLADLGFYFSLSTDNRINYGPVLENIVYCYAKSQGY